MHQPLFLQALQPLDRCTQHRRQRGSPHGDVLLQAGAEGAAGDLAHLLAIRRQHLHRWQVAAAVVGGKCWQRPGSAGTALLILSNGTYM